MEPIYVKPADAMRLFGISKERLASLVREGKLSKFKLDGKRKVLYSVAELKQFIESTKAVEQATRQEESP